MSNTTTSEVERMDCLSVVEVRGDIYIKIGDKWPLNRQHGLVGPFANLDCAHVSMGILEAALRDAEQTGANAVLRDY